MDRYHSMAAYILEASPYVGPEDQTGPATQSKPSRPSTTRRANAWQALIESLGAVPHVGPYSRRLAELNYLSIHHLRRYLADQLLEQVVVYKALLRASKNAPRSARQSSHSSAISRIRRDAERLRACE